MDDAAVEEVARRLAEFEIARLHVERRSDRTGLELVTELHRAKARIAISTVDRFRRKGKSH
jgi:hypothetical protein